MGDEIVNAGITGEAFVGRIEGLTTLGDREAVITSVDGRAFVTGHHRFVVDERDPLGGGFLLRLTDASRASVAPAGCVGACNQILPGRVPLRVCAECPTRLADDLEAAFPAFLLHHQDLVFGIARR